MDFTKILDAIDIIVNQKLSEAAFTRFINGTVIEIVNSEQNTYKVTTDGGKSSFIAQAVAADINGSIIYEKDDEVKLLQLNGSNNSNENIYILGHSADFTKQDLNEIKSYFVKNRAKEITDNNIVSSETGFIIDINNAKEVLDDIKQKCSFGLSVNLKTPFKDDKPLDDYGFEVNFLDENDKILLLYKLNVNNMVGEPYKFTDFVPQKIERYITNSAIVNQINKIKIKSFGLQSSEYNSLELYSAIWTQDTNDYKVTFKNPTRVDYITDKENDKTKFSLQAILLKNNKTFATNTCKYLWFKKNINITQGSNEYSFYGGEGWELLNEVEDITYLDINQIERTDRVIKNNISSTLVIDKESATMYHNYYKCVVLYNDLRIESETKHILNIDAAGDVNLRLGQTVGEATAAQIIELNETVNTFTEDGFYLGFIFKAVADISKYKVTIVRKTDQDDTETTYIFSTEPNIEKGEKQIYNLNGEYYGTIKQDYDKSYSAYMYTCSVVSEVEENKFTLLESIEKSYLSANSEIKEIIQYYDCKEKVIIPTSFIEENWVDNYTDIPNWETTNILARKKLSGVKNSEWEYYWYSIKGSRQSAQQRDTFNRLTKNGTERGLYYGEGYVETVDKEPDKNKTYYLYDDTSGYAIQENLTAFKADKIYYEYNNNALFFNADYINTGSLRVGNGENERFFADIKSNIVRIGGFVVDNKTLKSKDNKDNLTGFVGISTGYQYNSSSSGPWAFWSGNNNPDSNLTKFKVDINGNLYTKYINASGGWIGDLQLLNGKLKGTGFTLGSNGLTFKNNNDEFTFNKEGLKFGDNFQIDPTGNIIWGNNLPKKKQLYNEKNYPLPDNKINYDNFGDNYNYSSNNGWHKKLNTSNDYYYCESDDGIFQSGTNSILRLQGKNGTNGKDGTDANVTIENMRAALANSDANDGIYQYTVGENENKKTYIGIRASAIQAIEINADQIKAGTLKGIFCNIDKGVIGKIQLDNNGLDLSQNSDAKIKINQDTYISNSNFICNDNYFIGNDDVGLKFIVNFNNTAYNETFQIEFTPAYYQDPDKNKTNGIQMQYKITRKNSSGIKHDIQFGYSVNFKCTASSPFVFPDEETQAKNAKIIYKDTTEFIQTDYFNSAYRTVNSVLFIRITVIINYESNEKQRYSFYYGYNSNEEWKWNWKQKGYTNTSFEANLKITTECNFYGGENAHLIKMKGSFIPNSENSYDIGGPASAEKWRNGYFLNNIYNKDGVISTSDRNLKKDIQLLPTEYDLLYDKLEPIRYKFIQNESDRYHIGFISQDVEEALRLANLTSKDFAGFIKIKKEDSEDEFSYGLRYGEFIALNTDQIQKLKKRVLLLEQEIKEIKGENNNETL